MRQAGKEAVQPAYRIAPQASWGESNFKLKMNLKPSWPQPPGHPWGHSSAIHLPSTPHQTVFTYPPPPPAPRCKVSWGKRWTGRVMEGSQAHNKKIAVMDAILQPRAAAPLDGSTAYFAMKVNRSHCNQRSAYI